MTEAAGLGLSPRRARHHERRPSRGAAGAVLPRRSRARRQGERHGTVVVLEAVKARLNRIRGLAYASSTAVYNAADPSPAPETGGTAPSTLYGVFKLANEGTARVYWQDDDVASIGIRPYVVYGPGRDQGLTSGPSLAMEAAARGDGHTIAYGGTAQYDFAPGRGASLRPRCASSRGRSARRELPGRPVDDAGGRRRDRVRRAGGCGQGLLGGGPASVPGVPRGQTSSSVSSAHCRARRSTTACERRSSTSAREPEAHALGSTRASGDSTLAQLTASSQGSHAIRLGIGCAG